MKMVVAIIRHEKLQEVQDVLDECGVSGVTVTEVKGCGAQRGYTEKYRGTAVHISLRPRLKIEAVMQVGDRQHRGRQDGRGRAADDAARWATARSSSSASRTRCASAPASTARKPSSTPHAPCGGINRHRKAARRPAFRRPRLPLATTSWPSTAWRLGRCFSIQALIGAAAAGVADHPVDELPIAEQAERRDAHHAVADGDLLVDVDVQLADASPCRRTRPRAAPRRASSSGTGRTSRRRSRRPRVPATGARRPRRSGRRSASGCSCQYISVPHPAAYSSPPDSPEYHPGLWLLR